MATQATQSLPCRLEAITPRVPVTDIDSALAFYVGQLGFSLGWKWGEPTTHANVCRDAVSLDLLRVEPGRQGAAMAYVRVSDVNRLHAEFLNLGVPVSALEDRPYGMRDFEVIDPFGNRLAFGEPAT